MHFLIWLMLGAGLLLPARATTFTVKVVVVENGKEDAAFTLWLTDENGNAGGAIFVGGDKDVPLVKMLLRNKQLVVVVEEP